jgi:hypothetical protein
VVQIRPPGFAVTVYPVIAEPPLTAGAVHETATDVSPRTTVTLVGAFGTVAGVIAFEIPAVELSGIALVATTAKVYAVPFVRPVTVHVVGDKSMPTVVEQV